MDHCLSSPILCEKILSNLDNQSLANCRIVSKHWKMCIDNDFTLWTQMLSKSVLKEFENLNCIDTCRAQNQESDGSANAQGLLLMAPPDLVTFREPCRWKRVLKKISIENITLLAKSVNSFEKKFSYNYYYPPHYPVSLYSKLCEKNDSALLTLYKHIIERTEEYNVELPNIPWNWNVHNTALHNFAANGHFGICQIIIENEVDKHPTDYFGNTPLHIAAENGHLEVCQCITEKVTDKNPANTCGTTPLHLAAEQGYLEICQLIIENISNKNPANKRLNTPLHEAAEEGHLKVCELILENVTDKNPANECGNTPLHEAAYRGYLDICRFIIEKVPDKNPANHQGITPLHQAAYGGHLEVCELITDKVMDKNPGSKSGDTPLHRAAEATYGHFSNFERGYLEICKLIIDNVQDKNPANKDGFTPLHKAAYHGNLEICKLILKNVAIKDPVSNDGQRPLDMSYPDHPDICQLFKDGKTLVIDNELYVPPRKRKKF